MFGIMFVIISLIDKEKMTTRSYKPSHNRYQTMLLQPSIEDYVSLNNPVRAIDAYFETLDLVSLNF
jgi:hypothetical protein